MKATEAQLDADAFLEGALADADTGFSIGVSGAIAEFMRNDGEAEIRRHGMTHTILTRDGAMRVALTPQVVAVAAKLPSKRAAHWQQQVAFCLHASDAAMSARRVLTELGADADAIDASGRRQLCFDLGLGIAHVDACIRTGDTELIATLRRFEGKALLTEAKPARDAVIAASPPRVFRSRLGRIEVYSPIPERETPMGPHTHLIPALLGRPSPMAAFLPAGLVSCLDVYPASPLTTTSGKSRPFDRQRHASFQHVLEAWAPLEYLSEKRRLVEWVRRGRLPEECRLADGVLAEIGRRVALRQLEHEGAEIGVLSAWQRALSGVR